MSEIQRDLLGEKLNNLLSLKLLQICCNPSSEDVQKVRRLLRMVTKRGNSGLINQAEHDGITPLWYASYNGYLEIVKVLTAAGALVDKAKNDGITPLYIASEKGHLEIVKVLIAAGAKVNQADFYTPLYAATFHGHLEVVKVLIAAGGSVNEADNNGDKPLMTTICILELVKALIESFSVFYILGNTFPAAQNQKGHTEIVKYLQSEIKWQRLRPLYLMRFHEDYKENKAHRPTFLGRFLVSKNDQEGQDIKRLIASYL